MKSNNIKYRLWSQKAPDAVSEVANYNFFLGKHTTMQIPPSHPHPSFMQNMRALWLYLKTQIGG